MERPRIKPATSPIEMVRKRELAKLLHVSPWTIDRWRRLDASFPQPIWLTATTPAWSVREVERWLASRQRGGLAPSWGERGTRQSGSGQR